MTDIVHMRNDVIESITKGIQVLFEYKADGGIVTSRTVTPAKFYSDFTGFTGYDTNKKEDRNFRFDRVEKWKGLYGNETEWEIEIHREGLQLESYTVVAKDEEEAREIFDSGEYNFNFSHEFSPDKQPEEEDIVNIEEVE
jgi:predicted DNA-binding transcriptional regulator YafY